MAVEKTGVGDPGSRAMHNTDRIRANPAASSRFGGGGQ